MSSITNGELNRVRKKTKEKLMTAYEGYQRREPGSADRLMEQVRKFAYTKVYHLEHDFENFGSSQTADDWAQNVSLAVWKGLDKFQGTPALFYSWVHKICFNEATDAFNIVKEESLTKVALFVKSLDEDSDEKQEEINPEIYRLDERETMLSIPASIQGVDRNICSLIIDGMNYAQVAEGLRMTEGAVKMRLLRLRDRMKAEREATRPTGK